MAGSIPESRTIQIKYWYCNIAVTHCGLYIIHNMYCRINRGYYEISRFDFDTIICYVNGFLQNCSHIRCYSIRNKCLLYIYFDDKKFYSLPCINAKRIILD